LTKNSWEKKRETPDRTPLFGKDNRWGKKGSKKNMI